MQYINYYKSPIGKIILAADKTCLTGLWFEGQKHSERYLAPEHEESNLPIFEAEHWLDIYS